MRRAAEDMLAINWSQYYPRPQDPVRRHDNQERLVELCGTDLLSRYHEGRSRNPQSGCSLWWEESKGEPRRIPRQTAAPNDRRLVFQAAKHDGACIRDRRVGLVAARKRRPAALLDEGALLRHELVFLSFVSCWLPASALCWNLSTQMGARAATMATVAPHFAPSPLRRRRLPSRPNKSP